MGVGASSHREKSGCVVVVGRVIILSCLDVLEPDLCHSVGVAPTEAEASSNCTLSGEGCCVCGLWAIFPKKAHSARIENDGEQRASRGPQGAGQEAWSILVWELFWPS